MYKGIIVTKQPAIVQECRDIIARVGNIELDAYESIHQIHFDEVFNFLFIVITDIDRQGLTILSRVQSLTPGLAVILYNHSLNFNEIPDLSLTSKVKMIIGENRRSDLAEILQQLQDNYWRKIPYEKFGVEYAKLSPRMKRAMQFIESAPIRDCNISAISTYLNISPGYFSQEFKRETDQSFRSFMQKVIDYYENLIFTKVDLPTKNISQILGYSELSSFSRSFKNRKGVSPSQFKKMMSTV